MVTRFIIFPERNLNVFVHSGYIGTTDSLESLIEYRKHPDHTLNQMQLIDCSRVEDFDREPVNFIQAQMIVSEAFPPTFPDQMLVLYDRGGAGRELAQLIYKSWNGIEYVAARIAHSEAEALDILGQPERSFEDLHRNATHSCAVNPFIA